MLSKEEILLIIYFVVVILLLTAFVIVFFVVYQRRKNKMLQEQFEAKQRFEREIAELKLRVRQEQEVVEDMQQKSFEKLKEQGDVMHKHQVHQLEAQLDAKRQRPRHGEVHRAHILWQLDLVNIVDLCGDHVESNQDLDLCVIFALFPLLSHSFRSSLDKAFLAPFTGFVSNLFNTLLSPDCMARSVKKATQHSHSLPS